MHCTISSAMSVTARVCDFADALNSGTGHVDHTTVSILCTPFLKQIVSE